MPGFRNSMKNPRLLRLFLAIEIGIFSSNATRAESFPLQITATATNFSLGATTTPPGRLAWLMGNRPNEVTNLIELENLPMAQHGYTLNFSGQAAFYRAVLVDTNVVTATLAVGINHAVAVMTNGIMECWGDNTWGDPRQYEVSNIPPRCSVYRAIAVRSVSGTW